MKTLFIQIVLLLPLLYVQSSELHPSKNNTTGVGTPKGYLVSVEELIEIRDKAAAGIEPHYSNVNAFLASINAQMAVSNNWPVLSGEVVISGGSSDPIQLGAEGGRLVYGTALAWHLTGDEKYAKKCRELILDLTDTYGYRNHNRAEFHWGAQGILNLARGGTPYIYAADLLENWEGWSAADKLTYQVWLRDIKYNKVASASRSMKHNWGTSSSFSAAAIAFYLMDHPDWELEEIHPVNQKLSPQEAFDSHNAYQIWRQSNSEEWRMNSRLSSLWGILPNGAIPDEIRRGDDPVDGDYLPSMGSGTTYTMTYIEHLTAHAEFLRRRGDSSLYDNIAEDGSESLLQAYLFVIDNHIGSHCFTTDRRNAMYMAYNYYKHPALLRSLQECGESNITGQRMALYGRMTHPIAIPSDPIPKAKWTIYNAGELPSSANPVWNSSTADYQPELQPDYYRAGNQFLRFQTSSDNTGIFLSEWSTSLNFPALINGMDIVNPDQGITVSWAAKPIEGINSDLIIEIRLENGSYAENIRISKDRIELKYSGVVADVPQSDKEWRIYRARINNTKDGALVQVHIDGVYKPVLEGISLELSDNVRLGMGDFSDDKTVAGLVDWIAWDATGSYHTMTGEPLPASLGSVPPRRAWSMYDATELPGNAEPAWHGASANYIPLLIDDPEPVHPDNKFLSFQKPYVDNPKINLSAWKMTLPPNSPYVTKGMTVAWRIRPLEQSGSVVVAQIKICDGAREQNILISRHEVRLLNSRGNPFAKISNFNDWVVFRVTVVSNLLNLYIGENKEPVLLGYSLTPNIGERWLSFGDFSNEYNVQGQFDWIIWDYDRAIKPGDDQPFPWHLNTSGSDQIMVSTSNPVTVTPRAHHLHNNYPNPFKHSTSIVYELTTDSDVIIEVLSILGQLVKIIDPGSHQPAGQYAVSLDASDLPGGIYLVRMQAGTETDTRRITIVK